MNPLNAGLFSCCYSQRIAALIVLCLLFVLKNSSIPFVDAECIVRDDCSYALRVANHRLPPASPTSNLVFEGGPVRVMQNGTWHNLSCEKIVRTTNRYDDDTATRLTSSWELDYGILSINIDNMKVPPRKMSASDGEGDQEGDGEEICIMTYTTTSDIIVGHTNEYKDGDGITTFPSFFKPKQLEEAEKEVEKQNTFQFQLDGQLSWHGTFVRPKVNVGCTSGILGGPCMIYETDHSSRDGVAIMFSPATQFLSTTQYVTLPPSPPAAAAPSKKRELLDHGNGQNGTTETLTRNVVKDVKQDASAGDDATTDELVWGASTKSSIEYLPKGYSHSFVALIGRDGVTDTIDKWGSFLRGYASDKKGNSHGHYQAEATTTTATSKISPFSQFPSSDSIHTIAKNSKWYDLTIQTLGYQTDNGAQYCYCETDCDQALLDVVKHDLIETHHVPLRYLSYQNSWWKSTWSSPWCVSDWDTWNTSKVPMGVPEFARSLDHIPLQLYAPYFCNDTVYMKDHTFITSNRSLPLCRQRLDFRQVVPEESYDFFTKFFLTGISYGMMSYEWDFITENIVCNDQFHTTIGAADYFIHGMVQAGQDLNLTMQWCMPPPAIALESIYYPSVTNARASDDFLIGESWQVGTSSLLLWALGLAPSTDTFWTSDNGDVATTMGGCLEGTCPPDHSDVGCELHTILAIMSTGPVGFSDAVNQTNVQRTLRTCRSSDGVLLQPSKPLTTLDRYLDTRWRILQSYSGPTVDQVFAYYIVAHHLTHLPDHKVTVQVGELWPHPQPNSQWFAVWNGGGGVGNNSSTTGNSSDPCTTDGAPASECGKYVTAVSNNDDNSRNGDDGTITLEETSNDFEPTRVSLFRVCPDTGWILLGELSKYVSVSIPYRFTDIECLDSGLLFKIHGSKKSTKGKGGRSGVGSDDYDDDYEVVTVSAIHGDKVHVQNIKISSSSSFDSTTTIATGDEGHYYYDDNNNYEEEVVVVGRFGSDDKIGDVDATSSTTTTYY